MKYFLEMYDIEVPSLSNKYSHSIYQKA